MYMSHVYTNVLIIKYFSLLFFFLSKVTEKPAETRTTEEIYHQPSQVSECRAVGCRCKMAGTAMHASLGSQCVTLRIQRICQF